MAFARFFTLFPFRPIAFFTSHKTPTKSLTYWHRAHTSKTKLPVLFIHGIGIGLYPYVKFLAELNHATEGHEPNDGDVGIIALEIMPISFRMTGAALEREEMCGEILKILRKHGWEKVVVVTHSYGSVIATHLLHDARTAPMIGPLLLVDPVTFLLHLPDVAYNFVARPPCRANEWQLYYFASMDMGVAHTLHRRFFWSQNVLWKEDLVDRRVTVVLSGQDLIVNTEAVGQYLTGGEDGWKEKEWSGTGIDVIWNEELDHAQIFDKKRARKTLVHVVKSYCKPEGGGNGMTGKKLE